MSIDITRPWMPDEAKYITTAVSEELYALLYRAGRSLDPSLYTGNAGDLPSIVLSYALRAPDVVAAIAATLANIADEAKRQAAAQLREAAVQARAEADALDLKAEVLLPKAST